MSGAPFQKIGAFRLGIGFHTHSKTALQSADRCFQLMGDIGDKRFCVVTLFVQRQRFYLQFMSQFEEGVGEGFAKNRLPIFQVHKG